MHRRSGSPDERIIHDGSELHFGADILASDLTAWRRARLSEVPDTTTFEVAPDCVAEVPSPWAGALARVEKLPNHAREGILHVWLLPPRARTLEASALTGDRYQLLGAWRTAESERAAPFEALELQAVALWAR